MEAPESTTHTRGRLRNKIALVSGAASGIGQATAVAFGLEGARVAACDIDQGGLDETVRTISSQGGQALACTLDVTSEPAWTAALRTIGEEWGALDIMVNCAGISGAAHIMEMTMEQWRQVMSINLDGTFLGTAAAMRAMKPVGTGSIINMASSSGLKAAPGASAYCASKAAIIHFTRTAALECAQAGMNVRVNCVVPGAVRTPMWKKTSMWPDIAETPEWKAGMDTNPLHRFAEPREIAQAIVFLASDESSFVSGSALVVDGGYTA